jgi:hypothetical protein
MEVEQDRTLPFLEVLLSRKLNGTIRYTVQRKSTNMDLYLHAKSEHQPSQNRAALTTLIRRAKSLCYPVSLGKEIKHLIYTFQKTDTARAKSLHPKQKPELKNNKPTGIAVLPYQQAVSDKISRLLTK